MNKEMTDEEFYSIQDTEELVDMCLTKDHNIKIFQQQLDQANKKLDKIKELIKNNEHTKVDDENGVIMFYTNLKSIIEESDKDVND